MKVLFVDPFSSVHYLADKLKAGGLSGAALYTLHPEGDYIARQEGLFEKIFLWDGKTPFADLLSTLRQEQFDRVYYGSESSVPLVDQIATQLTPSYANSPETSALRCNKFYMQQALAQAGLPAIQQLKVLRQLTDVQQQTLSTWQFPLIVKPLNNAGSIGVEKCDTLEEVVAVLAHENTTNAFGVAVEEFLIQEWIGGEEYFVDSFSVNGKHHFSGMQKYCRVAGSRYPVALYSEVVPISSAIAKEGLAYLGKVLDAVGLKNGLAHTEFKMTDRGIYLMEVNPRISGAHGCNNRLFELCGLPAQMDLLVAHCLGRSISTIPTPVQDIRGRKLCLQNTLVPRKLKPLNMDFLQTLSSFREGHMLKTPATELIELPKNITDTIAMVLITNEDAVQLERDYHQCVIWQEQGALF